MCHVKDEGARHHGDHFVVLAVLLLCINSMSCSQLVNSYAAVHSAGQCYNVAGVPRLDLNECDAQDMLLTLDAFQGHHHHPQLPPPPTARSQYGRRSQTCRYSRDDCTEAVTADMENRLSTHCVGRPECSITVDVGWMKRCNTYGQYAHVIYQCVPRETVTDICSVTDRVADRTVYLISPGYPADYRPDVECVCTAVTDRDQRLLVRVVGESTIEWSENCRRDALLVYDGLDLIDSRCGKLSPGFNLTTRTNAVLVGFRSDGSGQHKGFWIAIEALGKISLTCGPASVLLTSDTSNTMATSFTTDSQATETIATPTSTANESTVFDELSADLSRDTVTDGKLRTLLQDDDQKTVPDSGAEELSTLLAIIVSIVFVSIVIIAGVFFASWIRRRRNKAQISGFHSTNHHDSMDPDALQTANMPRFGMACHTPTSFAPLDQSNEDRQSPAITVSATTRANVISPLHMSSSSSSPLATTPAPTDDVDSARRMQATPPRSQRHQRSTNHKRARYITGGGLQDGVRADGPVGAVKPSVRSPRLAQSATTSDPQARSRRQQPLAQVPEVTSTGWSTSPVVDVRHYLHHHRHDRGMRDGHQAQTAHAHGSRVTSPAPSISAIRVYSERVDSAMLPHDEL